MSSVNDECSYARGDGCLVQSMPHLVRLETCGLCKLNNLHHFCEDSNSHKQVLLRLGVEYYEGLHTCFNCLPDQYPELSEKVEENGLERALGRGGGNNIEWALGGGAGGVERGLGGAGGGMERGLVEVDERVNMPPLDEPLVEVGERANMPPLDEPSPYIALLQDDDLEQDKEDDDYTFGELYQHSARKVAGRWI